MHDVMAAHSPEIPSTLCCGAARGVPSMVLGGLGSSAVGVHRTLLTGRKISLLERRILVASLLGTKNGK